MKDAQDVEASSASRRGAGPLLLGVAALLALLIALMIAAIALFVTPPPAKLAAASSSEAQRPAPVGAPEAAAPNELAAGPVVLRRAPRTIAGRAEVIDTGTLRIGAATVRLRGVAGEGGRQAARMANYLAGRAVACAAHAAGRHRCRVDRWDLSEVVLFNGVGRASPDAPADLRRLETQARAARRGVWRTAEAARP